MLCVLWSSLKVQAQTILTGTVRTSAGQPLGGIVLEAETKAQPPATAFVITGPDGKFSITLAAVPASDSLRLSARALGYSTQLLRLANHTQSVVLTMREEATQLKEVTVRAPPVVRHGDTLSYKVDAFSSKNDRVISDVLKKMPGVELGSDGQIRYEGRPISKFYINGQDLLESRYNLASDNLPVDAVQSVQVLENHQPIRALGDKIRPENAALNIQLKHSITATGQVRLGAGVVPTPPAAVWNANLSPMLFTKRQQFIDTYQSNNTGQNVAAELNPLTLDDLQQQSESSSQKPVLTGVLSLGNPPVAASRYLFNQVHLFSANHLVKLSGENQLRVNTSYLHDAQRQSGTTRTAYYLPGAPPVVLTESSQNRLFFNSLQTDLSFIRNVQSYYLKNTLSLDRRWDSQTGDLDRLESGLRIRQTATNPFVALTNRLGLVRPLGAGRTLQASSLIFYTSSPQQLTVSPGPFARALTGGVAYDTARQQVRQRAFFTNNSLGLSVTRGRWGYGSTAGFSAEIQRLTSGLTTAPVATAASIPWQNNLHRGRTRAYLQLALSYRAESWNASLEMPLNYYSLQATDAPMTAGQRQQALVAEPRLRIRRDLGALWYATTSTGLNNGFGDLSQLNYGYLLRDYRTLVRNDAPLPRSQGQNYQAGLYYRNPLKLLFFNISYSYSTTRSNRLYSSQVDGSGALTTQALDQEARRQLHTVSGSVSKFVSSWKTNLSAQFAAYFNRQPQVLNGRQALTQSRSATGSFKANVSAFAWGNLEYNASLTVLRSAVAEAPAQPLTLLQDHHATLSVFPISRHQISGAADYYDSRGPTPAVRALFADLTYRYALPTARKVDLEITWNNIFDTQRYQYSYVSQFVLAQTTYELRPAQVLASVRLSL